MALGNQIYMWRVQARIYDLGIVAVRLSAEIVCPLAWEAAIDHMAEMQNDPPAILAIFTQTYELIVTTIAEAINQPNAETRTEDYTILVIEQLGPGLAASALGTHPMLLQATLGERRALSPAAAALATSLSYYADDLLMLSWNAAIVIEPEAEAREDVNFLLEFANAQLLALRSYDDQVELELTRIIRRLASARSTLDALTGSTTRFLLEIHALIAEITETSARVENALKVTEDVYWNRVYTAALAVLRVDVWRTGIDETLTVLRQAAAQLNDEAEIARTNLLEITVILLIVFEVVLAILGLRR